MQFNKHCQNDANFAEIQSKMINHAISLKSGGSFEILTFPFKFCMRKLHLVQKTYFLELFSENKSKTLCV